MIESPCIKLCQIEPISKLCIGCWRTLDEIARWSQSSDADKQRVLAAVAQRRPSTSASNADADSGA